MPEMTCYRHPNEETLLRCGKCERPICPKCTKYGPVGARCRDCSSHKGSPLYQVSADKLAVATVVGLVVSFGVGYLLASAQGYGIFVLLWGAILGGGAIGEAILRAANRKRGIKMEVITGACSVVGILGAFGVWYISHRLPADPLAIAQFLQLSPFTIVSAGITVFSAVSRVRFF
jgi:hypothetical protein